MSIGNRIRLLRESKGLTQDQVGHFVGVTRGAVSQWELGQVGQIKVDHFFKLSQCLEIDAGWLLTGHGSPDPRAKLSDRALALAYVYDNLPEAARSPLNDYIAFLIDRHTLDISWPSEDAVGPPVLPRGE